MASSPPTSPPEEHHQHKGDVAREATEMGDYDEVLRRSSVFTDSSAQRPRASNATTKGVYFPSTRRSLANLWQRQVSATVPHDACRDHLGTPTFPFARPAALMVEALWTVLLVRLRFTTYLRSRLSWRTGQFTRSFQQALCETSATKFYLPSPFPALERTFLGYLRTSLALSMVSVIIAQLFRLQHAQNPNKVFGFFVLGIPLACVCIGAATIVLLLGAYRFWRQQNAILRGKVHAGGWEVNAIGLTITSVVLTLFVLLVAVDAWKDTLDAT